VLLERQRFQIRLHPPTTGIDAKQSLASPVRQQPIGSAQRRSHQSVAHGKQTASWVLPKKTSSRAQRRLSYGLVIAVGVGIGNARGLVISANEARHVTRGVQILAAGNQP